jgi:hypothetical protein
MEMITWFKALPTGGKVLTGGIALVLILAAIYGIVASIRGAANDERAENNQFINQGVTQEREAAKTEVLNHVEEATDARNNPTDADRRVVCEKYDRNCQNGQ